MINLTPKKEITLSPCDLYDYVYSSLKIKNLTDTPCYFQFSNYKEPFDIIPKFGLIKSNSMTNVLIQFHPKDYDFY